MKMVDQTIQEMANGMKISVVDVPKTDNVPPQEKPAPPPEKKCGDVRQLYFTMFVAELIGTGLLMFLGCLGCVNTFDEPQQSHHFSGITFGLTVMLIIQTFGHISGAHLNPAVTLATLLFGILKPTMAFVYIIAQFAGATLGYGLLKILISEHYAPDGFCVTNIDGKISPIQGLGIEVVITTVLILICCAVWDKRNINKPDSTPLRFGLAISAISMAAGPLTGASMNTARSFAPLVFGGSWSNQWIYWVGPNLGPFLGCGIYKFMFSEPNDEDLKKESIYLEEAHQSVEKV